MLRLPVPLRKDRGRANFISSVSSTLPGSLCPAVKLGFQLLPTALFVCLGPRDLGLVLCLHCSSSATSLQDTFWRVRRAEMDCLRE